MNTPIPPKGAPKVGFVSLGCPKALVDSERILTRLRAEGYETAETYDGADVVVVNTCGFISSARTESFEAIGEAMTENGRVIVTGCLGVDEAAIRESHSNVLSVTGPHQYEQVMKAVHEAVPPAHDPHLDLVPPGGMRLTPRHYAYLKIAEGCNNACAFCIIPSLRGRLQSRPAGEVMAEAEALADAGVKELLIVSQDTAAYGLDLKYAESSWTNKTGRDETLKARFYDMAEAMGTLHDEFGLWVRMHYIYPYPHVDDIIPLMAEGKILPYLDIPFQHASPKILKAMKRPGDQEKMLRRIESWRETCPDLTIRSTFIVGFPGETEDDFEDLLDWLEEARLDRVGCFKYEDVAGAPANALPDHLDEDEKEDRMERFMETQRAISTEKQKAKIGKTFEVLIDDVSDDSVIGRTKGDAPEIDGSVHMKAGDFISTPKSGDRVTVIVTKADDYDLWAKPRTAD